MIEQNPSTEVAPSNPVLEIRHKLKLTQEQMARELRCSLGTVRLCETQPRLPRGEAVLEHLRRLAARAGVRLP